MDTSLQRSNSGIPDGDGPHVSHIKQQRLTPVCSPILTSNVIRYVLIFVGVIFTSLGALLFVSSQDVKEQRVTYHNHVGCEVTSADTNATLPKFCTVTFTLDEDMDLPVYFYYELGNFYQNHRNYLQSYSHYQLVDEDLTNTGPSSGTGSCDPLKKYQEDVIYPCGLVANSFFSDRFSMSVNGDNLCPNCTEPTNPEWNYWFTAWEQWFNDVDGYWKKSGIAWEVDVDERFSYKEPAATDQVTRYGYLQQKQGLLLPKISDEDYMVWARTAALPNFRKLHRIIDKLPSGENKLKKSDTLQVTIANWFAVDEFDGEKHFVLTTLTWFGGSAFGLAIGYLVIGILSILFAIFIFIFEPTRKLGDYTHFEWENISND